MIPFQITQDSLERIRKIDREMENKTFHYHIHLLYDIRTFFGKDRVTYLEIGSYAGGSQSLMSSHEYPTNCVSLDLGHPIDKNVVVRNVERFSNPQSTFQYIQGNSHDENIIKTVHDNVGECEILFIDGDHSKVGTIQDFENYSDLVLPNGFIIFDDYMDSNHSPEVKTAVDEIVTKLNKENFNIIGSISYDLLSDFSKHKSSNLFIIQKL